MLKICILFVLLLSVNGQFGLFDDFFGNQDQDNQRVAVQPALPCVTPPTPPPPSPQQVQQPAAAAQWGYQGSQQAEYNGETVVNMRGCTNYQTHLACSNVYVSSTGLQGILGCPSATSALQASCADTWAVSTKDCCWCDQGGNRCLLRASKPEAYIVPTGVSIISEPHYRDLLGVSWDYQGVDDHILMEVVGFRVDVKLSSCSGRNDSDVTCMTEAALVDTTTGESIQFKIGTETPFTCSGPIAIGKDYTFSVGALQGVELDTGNSVAKFQVRLGSKLMANVVVGTDFLNVIVSVGIGFKDGELLGGLLSGVVFGKVAAIWGPNLSKVRANLENNIHRLNVDDAFTIGVSWRLKPEDSYICSTKTNPYQFVKDLRPAENRVVDIVTNELRLKYNHCCYMLMCSPQVYDECVFDHHQLNVDGDAQKCHTGYNTVAEHHCSRTSSGNCKGGWLSWSECTNGTSTRQYIIEKVRLPGFQQCNYTHGFVQTKVC